MSAASVQKAQVVAQIEVSKSLALGCALSLLPVGGIGSVAAVVIGVRAQRKIAASGHPLVGKGLATWCIVAGALGVLANVFAWPVIRV